MSDNLIPEVVEKLKAMGVPEEAFEQAAPPQVEEPSPPPVEEASSELVEEAPPERNYEEEAAKTGWKPGGEKSAAEWVRTAELYSEITERGKEIKDLRKTVEDMKALMEKQQQVGYQRAKAELEAEKEDAIRSGNVDWVKEVESRIQQIPSYQQAASVPMDHPAVKDFLVRHQGLISDMSLEAQEIKAFIRQRDVELASSSLPVETKVATLEKDLEYKFPDYFKQTKAPAKAAVASDSAPVKTESASKKKYSVKNLTSEQKKIAHRLAESKVMTMEQYVEQLVALGEIK